MRNNNSNNNGGGGGGNNDHLTPARRRAVFMQFLFMMWMFTAVGENHPSSREPSLRGGGGLNQNYHQIHRNRFKDKMNDELGIEKNKTDTKQVVIQNISDTERYINFKVEQFNNTFLENNNNNINTTTPGNLTAVFSGKWKRRETTIDDENIDFLNSMKDGFNIYSALEINTNFTPAEGKFPLHKEQGNVKLSLVSASTKVSGLYFITGRLDLMDGISRTQRDMFTTLQGYYFENYGELTLFVTSGYKSNHVAIEYNNNSNQTFNNINNNILNTTDENMFSKVVEKLWTENGHKMEEVEGSTTSEMFSILSKEDSNFATKLEDMILQFSYDENNNDDDSNQQQEDLFELRPRVWDVELNKPSMKKSKISSSNHENKNKNSYLFDPYSGPAPCFLRLDLKTNSLVQAKTLNTTKKSIMGKTFEKLELDGLVTSSNCNISMEFVNMTAHVFDTVNIVRKASSYAWIETIIVILQTIHLVVQINYSSTQTNTAKVSILSISMMAILDAGFGFAYTCSGLVLDRLFSAFMITAFVKLLLFSVFELRYLLIIWKARTPQAFNDGPNALLRQQGKLYTRISFAVVVSVILCLEFPSLGKLFWFIGFSFWVPQIVSNIIRETSDPLNNWFLIWMSASRLFTPFYLYGCPSNFFELILEEENKLYDPMFCTCLSLWVVLQVLVLYIQSQYGPRVFIPKRFLPPKYDYNRKIPDPLRDTDCAICMLPVNGVDIEHMLTPCNHLYHRDCLRQWVLQKMECPTCRAQLPPL